MSANEVSVIVFACLFGGALLGLSLRAVLPEHHVSKETQDVVKLGMGMVASMAALVLGLLVASAKGSYDTQRGELTQMSANIIMLDRVLAHYGPETREARDLLRRSVASGLDRVWHGEGSQPAQRGPNARWSEALYDTIQQLSPKNDAQRSAQTQALNMVIDLAKTRWLLFEQHSSSISTPLLVVLVLWLTVLLVSFGLFAPRNGTVIAALLACSLAVSGALFLIMELDQPWQGIIQISSTPLRKALAQLGQ